MARQRESIITRPWIPEAFKEHRDAPLAFISDLHRLLCSEKPVESRGGAVAEGSLACCRPLRLPVPEYLPTTPFPPPARRTGRADLPHPALGQGLMRSLTRAGQKVAGAAAGPASRAGCGPS